VPVRGRVLKTRLQLVEKFDRLDLGLEKLVNVWSGQVLGFAMSRPFPLRRRDHVASLQSSRPG
jgi:hypothetical protein